MPLGFVCLLALPQAGLCGLVADWGSGGAPVAWDATNLVRIAAGSSHALGVRADGTVVAWGDNTLGQATVPAGLSNVVDVAAGVGFSVALRADGTLAAWGDDSHNQTDLPAGLSNVVAVAARQWHGLALEANGTLVAWGQNSYGDGAVPAGLSNVIAMAAGDFHNLALKSDGTVVAWGYNNYQQSTVPPGLSNVIAVAASYLHSLALTSDGKVVAWGDNRFHQLDVPAGLSNVTAIAAGSLAHSMALKDDGTVVCWGRDLFGETNVPSGLSGVTAIAAGDTFSLALTMDGAPVQILGNPNSQQITRGSNVTFTVAASGASPLSYQWFFNGQPLADSDRVIGTTNSTLTLSNSQYSDPGAYTVVVSNSFSSVLSAPANLVVFGVADVILQQGDMTVGAGANVYFSAQTAGPQPMTFQWFFDGVALPGQTNSAMSFADVQAARSGEYEIVVTNPYGTSSQELSLTVTNQPPLSSTVFIQNLGNSSYVPLGGTARLSSGATGSEPLSFQWWFDGQKLPGETNSTLNLEHMSTNQSGYYSVTVTNAFGGLVSLQAGVWAVPIFPWHPGWGGVPPHPPIAALSDVHSFSVGQDYVLVARQDGSVAVWPMFSPPPPQMTNLPAGLDQVVSLSSGPQFDLALKANGTVQAWGMGWGIQVPANLSGVVQIAAGGDNGIALKTNGTIAIWGRSYGPTNQIATFSNILAVAAGNQHSMALKSNGTVLVWGAATNLPGLSNVIAVAAGNGTCLALKADGTVAGWNSFGATPPTGLSNVVALSTGYGYNFALLANGTVKNWGSLDYIAPRLSNVVALATGQYYDAAQIGDGSPAIVLQPYTQTAERGTTVSLHSRAAGVQPMSYQWFFNGFTLPQATNASLILTNVSGPNIGAYSMAAFNALGAATSAVAVLSIAYPPLILQQPQLQSGGGFSFLAGEAGGGLLSTQDVSAFEVQMSSNLLDWVSLPSALVLTNGRLQVLDPGALRAAVRFYRVVEHR